MFKVNREELEWERHPDHHNEVYRHVLWENEETGAKIVIIRIVKGELIEQPAHSHPHTNQYTVQLSGRVRKLWSSPRRKAKQGRRRSAASWLP